MDPVHDSRLLADASWRKSGRSGAQGNCVELAPVAQTVAVRNSRHPAGPALRFPTQDMAAFLDAVKDGEFDDLLPRA